jgi:hypothetical protein
MEKLHPGKDRTSAPWITNLMLFLLSLADKLPVMNVFHLETLYYNFNMLLFIK